MTYIGMVLLALLVYLNDEQKYMNSYKNVFAHKIYYLPTYLQIRSDSYDIRVTSQTYSYYHTDHPFCEVIGWQRCIASWRVSFYTPTNTHVHLSAPRLYFPFLRLRAFCSNRYLFYNEVLFHTQFKSDIYQVSINVDKT